MKFRRFLLASAATVALGAFSQSASAAVVQFNFDNEFSGGQIPAGATPWLTATFDDGGSAGSVQLTLDSGLVANEFYSGIYFNLDPALDASALGFAYDGASTGPAASVSTGTDAFQADGDGLYDILFSFPTSNAGDRFGAGESVTYSITGAGLTADDFAFFSAPRGGKGPFFAAAHVQGIGVEFCSDQDAAAGGCGSGWIAPPVPVPAAVWLFASGLLGLVGVARRKRA